MIKTPGKHVTRRKILPQDARKPSEPIKLTLHTLPPAINDTYKTGNGRFYKDKEAETAQFQIWAEAKSQYSGKPLTNPVALDILFYFKDKRRDIDSGIKALLDCLSGVCYEDDRQIEQLYVRKNYSKKDPRCEVTIYEL